MKVVFVASHPTNEGVRRRFPGVASGLLALACCLALTFAASAQQPTSEIIPSGNVWPYTTIVHLYTTWPDGQVFMDSGTMIDRFHVLTVAHAVYDHRHGGWAAQIDVYAGQSGANKPFEVAYATFFRAFPNYMDEDDTSETGCHSVGNGDIGLVTLDRPLGDETGWLSYFFNNDDKFFEGRTFATTGYPGGEAFGGQMVHQTGPLIGAMGGAPSFGTLQWSLDSMTSIPGQSGSCLIDPESGLIYGVLDLGDDQYGYGERITEDVFNTLNQWLDEDAA